MISMSYLSKLAEVCRKCPNVDTCTHKKMKAEAYLIPQTVAEDVLMPSLRETTTTMFLGEPVITYKDVLERELNRRLYPDFLKKKFNVR